MVPLPNKGMRNKRFLYFYRPYSFNVNTSKCMVFGKEDKDGMHAGDIDLQDYVQTIRDGQKRQKVIELEKKNANLLWEADMKGAKNANKRQNQRDQPLNNSQNNLANERVVDKEASKPEDYVSGWQRISDFFLKNDPRVSKFVIDQLKHRHKRLKRKSFKPKPESKKRSLVDVTKSAGRRDGTLVIPPAFARSSTIAVSSKSVVTSANRRNTVDETGKGFGELIKI